MKPDTTDEEIQELISEFKRGIKEIGDKDSDKLVEIVSVMTETMAEIVTEAATIAGFYRDIAVGLAASMIRDDSDENLFSVFFTPEAFEDMKSIGMSMGVSKQKTMMRVTLDKYELKSRRGVVHIREGDTPIDDLSPVLNQCLRNHPPEEVLMNIDKTLN
jgi:hypothetical protein